VGEIAERVVHAMVLRALVARIRARSELDEDHASGEPATAVIAPELNTALPSQLAAWHAFNWTGATDATATTVPLSVSGCRATWTRLAFRQLVWPGGASPESRPSLSGSASDGAHTWDGAVSNAYPGAWLPAERGSIAHGDRCETCRSDRCPAGF
jgi:hypothetical protein